MIRKWINKQENKNCILFFNGWGMDENAINHLDIGDFDICMFYDYTIIESIDEDFNSYNEVYLVAWSLGVWASAKAIAISKQKFVFSKAVALNGTLNPIDDMKGIPTLIFNTTLETWNERNREKFNMRILGGRKQYDEFGDRLSDRDIESQKSELQSIFKQYTSGIIEEIEFDVALIGRNDMVFNSTNQLSYWNDKAKIINSELPHYPFTAFENWRQIIEL